MNKVKQIFNKDSDSTGIDQTTQSGESNTLGSGNHVSGQSNTLGSSHNDSTLGSANREANTLGSNTETGESGHTGNIFHGIGLGNHSHSIQKDSNLEGAAGEKTHDHKHLSPITKEAHHHHETEEVQQVREHDRHVHHVQHHVQPVLDTKHHDREHTDNKHEVSKIHEHHVNTDEDKKLYAGLNTHKDSQHHHEKERTIVDRGEVVNENVHHHVHHVVQPVVERDTHHHSTIHTTIPIKHTTHEAPIIHQSSTHEPMHMKDFLSKGGDLTSKLTHDNAGVLADGDCQRESSGPVTSLAEKLHLGSGIHSHSHGDSTGANSATTGGGPNGLRNDIGGGATETTGRGGVGNTV